MPGRIYYLVWSDNLTKLRAGNFGKWYSLQLHEKYAHAQERMSWSTNHDLLSNSLPSHPRVCGILFSSPRTGRVRRPGRRLKNGVLVPNKSRGYTPIYLLDLVASDQIIELPLNRL